MFVLKTVCCEGKLAVIQMSLFSYDEEYEVVVIGKQNIYNILSVIVIFRFNVNECMHTCIRKCSVKWGY